MDGILGRSHPLHRYENANIITKVVLPAELFPTVGLSSTFFVNGVGMSLFVTYLVWAGFISWTWLWLLVPLSMIPSRFQAYLYFNPVFPFIQLFQQILLRQTMEPVLLGIATIWTVLSLFLGIFFFERLKPSFADVL